MSESDVARWHKLGSLPDNVTDEGDIVSPEAGRRASADKAQLRAAIDTLRRSAARAEARNLAKLATSYLLAGDVETARRYLEAARAAS